jgi:hypothetical protein
MPVPLSYERLKLSVSNFHICDLALSSPFGDLSPFFHSENGRPAARCIAGEVRVIVSGVAELATIALLGLSTKKQGIKRAGNRPSSPFKIG